MNKRDILEIKRRFTKKDCTFNRIRGCYVNTEKEKMVNINETFLNLDDEVFYKYLEIAKKTLSGTVDNNLLELEICYDENNKNEFQEFLLKLRDCDIQDDELAERFYDHIIETYSYPGNYLILLFHDSYDVMVKTTDNMKLDESEEVYKYLVCAICPVNLAKPALSYYSVENKIDSRVRDWIVGVPDNGFIFPAFTDRSTDIHNMMYYTKDANSPKSDFMEEGLFCKPRQTANEQKEIFADTVVSAAVGEDDEELGEKVLMDLQQGLKDMVVYREEIEDNNIDPILLTSENIKAALDDYEYSDNVKEKVENALVDIFDNNPPNASLMIDNKALIAHEQKVKEQNLVKEVCDLKKQLNVGSTLENVLNTDDILIKATAEGMSQISTTQIDGRECLVIPIR